MNDSIPERSAEVTVQSLSPENFDVILNHLVNGVLIVSTILGIPSVCVSLLRVGDIGWKPIMVLHLVDVVLLFIVTLFRHRFSYHVRVIVLLALLFSVSVAGLLTFGQASMGVSILLAGTILATVFLGLRSGIVVILVSVFICAFVGVLIHWGYVTYTIDFNPYLTHLRTWAVTCMVVALYGGICVTCLGLMRRSLVQHTSHLAQRSRELEQVNTSLEQEVDKRRKIEEQLQQSELKYRTLFEAANDAIFLMDQEVFTECNEKTLHVFGCQDKKQIVGKTPFEFSPAIQPDGRDSRESGAERIKAAYQGTPQFFEWQHCRADGTPFDVEVSLNRIDIQDRHILHAIVRDVSERKHIEAENVRLRQHLENVVNSMPSMLIGADLDGCVTQWNLEAQRRTGIEPQEALGQKLVDILPQWAEEMSCVSRAIQDRKVQNQPKVAHRDHGQMQYTDITVYPLVTNGTQGAVVRIDDITERVRLEEMMIQAEKMATLGGLAAGMAHEINNPLGVIVQGTQTVERRLSAELGANREVASRLGIDLGLFHRYLEERQVFHMLSLIHQAGLRAAKLVKNMLQFSRHSEVERRPESLSEVIADTLELAANDYDLRKRFDFRNIKIQCDLDGSLPNVNCVAMEVEQVILNLLKNAAQAMASNATSKPPTIIIRTYIEGNMACIEVEDNGPGMIEEIRQRVFEPFFTTKEVGYGTGLGLSICYMIITRNHHGSIQVDSEPGRGTLFTVRLPLHA